MTQSLAHKIIRTQKMLKATYREVLNRRATRRNMALAKGAASDKSKTPTSESAISSGRQLGTRIFPKM